MKPFTKIPNVFIDNSHGMRRIDFSLYVYLSRMRNGKTGTAWPKYETILKALGIKNRNSLANAIKRLEDAGWIELQRRPNKATEYTVTVPAHLSGINSDTANTVASSIKNNPASIKSDTPSSIKSDTSGSIKSDTRSILTYKDRKKKTDLTILREDQPEERSSFSSSINNKPQTNTGKKEDPRDRDLSRRGPDYSAAVNEVQKLVGQFENLVVKY